MVTEEQGLEPRLADPESAVLPLDDSPTLTDILAFTAWIGKLLNYPMYFEPHTRLCIVILYFLEQSGQT